MPVERNAPEGLLGLVQFRSQCQNFCFAGQPALVSRVERDLFQVMPDPQPHTCPAVSHRRARGTNGGGRCQGQVVACELLAGQSLPVGSGRRAGG